MIGLNTPGDVALIVLPLVLAAWFFRSVFVRGAFIRTIAAMESRLAWQERDRDRLENELDDMTTLAAERFETLVAERAARSRTDDAKLWAAVAERMPERVRPSPPWPAEALADLVDRVGGDLARVTFYVFAGPPIASPEDHPGDSWPTRPSALADVLAADPVPIAFWADGRASNMQPDPPTDDWVEGRVAARVAGLTKGLIADLAIAKRVRPGAPLADPAGGILDRRDVAAIDGGATGPAANNGQLPDDAPPLGES